MTGARPLSLSSILLWTACSFSSPSSGEPGDDGGGDGGGPGIPDGAPACVADDDKDTVCNPVDKCPGKDDRLDADSDAVPDGCDDWPCGAKPEDPGGFMDDSGTEGRSWSAGLINIGSSRRVVAAAGQPFSARFLWGIRIDCGGGQSSCRAQAEIGYGPMRTGCLFDSNVNDDQLTGANYDATLTAPSAPGVYEIRLNAGRSTSCGTSTSWYGSDPGPESTFAILCVRP
jgi:hypothetical protein